VNEVQSQTGRGFIASIRVSRVRDNARKFSRELTLILNNREANNQNLQDILAQLDARPFCITVQAVS
jgi:hypothetical protein